MKRKSPPKKKTTDKAADKTTGKPTKKGSRKAAPKKADSVLKEQRISDVLQMRLAGAQFHDILQYAKENWGAGSSRSQVCLYIQWTNEALAKARDKDREKMITLGLARRESIYANCVRGGDYGTALSTLKDISALEGHYPEKGQQNHAGGNTYINISIEERKRRISSVAEELGIEGLFEADAEGAAAGDPVPVGDYAHNGNGKHHHNGNGTSGADAATT